MPTKTVLIGTEFLPLVWSERRDAGEMFDATVGVARKNDRFMAFVKDGWGGGVSCTRDTKEAADGEIERLWEKFYG